MLEWQLEYLPQLAGLQSARYVQDEKLKAFGKFSKSQQALLNAALQDGAMQTIDMEQPEEEEIQAARDRYYAYQTAMGGTSACVGPPIETSVRALDMVRKDENEEELYEYTAFTKAQVKRKLKPFQVNGTAWEI